MALPLPSNKKLYAKKCQMHQGNLTIPDNFTNNLSCHYLLSSVFFSSHSAKKWLKCADFNGNKVHPKIRSHSQHPRIPRYYCSCLYICLLHPHNRCCVSQTRHSWMSYRNPSGLILLLSAAANEQY